MVLADPAKKASASLGTEGSIYFFLFIIVTVAILAIVFDPKQVAAIANHDRNRGLKGLGLVICNIGFDPVRDLHDLRSNPSFDLLDPLCCPTKQTKLF